ncbi:TAXI family TRAP transporter solute-binding subunit [Aminiphilus sp.]|jgi:TRAP transporter TAXI family solute receptor|uniref:TAXI family TRAP transporter solute-binding subunit n=1 Tax=Aminiphilus sp. TaxID=1872488 RepID=UPI002612ACCB|nr:TAXI family TRAP transporter solute-binding subunit [Aminiphilus sp.]
MRKKALWSALCAVLCLGLLVSGAFAATFLNIGTGTTGGTYYPVGAALAKIWSDTIPDVKASAQSTGGTVNNIQLMADGEAEMGFMDGLYYHAYMGQGKYEGNPQKDLRAMLPLYPEPIHLLVAKGSGIKSIADFKGKRVSIGAVASGTEVTARELLKAAGIDPDKDITPENLGLSDTAAAFGDKRIDCGIVVGSLGIAGVVEVTTLDIVEFIDLSDEVLDKVMEQTPYWVPFTIPANFYKNQTAPVKTYASWNIIAVKDSVDADLVYQLTKNAFDKKADVVAVNSKMETMLPENAKLFKIPMHPGAEKYYKEVGVIQ